MNLSRRDILRLGSSSCTFRDYLMLPCREQPRNHNTDINML
jgi:hypothetical protein